MNGENGTTGTRTSFSITAGGYQGLPLTMALGQFVTTSSPLLVELPSPVLDRAFAGGHIPLPVIPSKPSEFADTDETATQEIRQQERFFFSHLTDLLEKYEGKFVAILEGRVVDDNSNLDHLIERVYKKFGYRPILVRKVEKNVGRPYRSPLPRRLRVRQDAV